MHPTVAHLQALFAALGLWFNAFDLIEVRTVIGHHSSPAELYGGLNRNAHLESRIAGNRRYADLAADIFDDAVNDVKAKPRAFADALCSEKGIEDARFDFGRNARPIVGNFDENEIVFADDANLEFAVAVHRVSGVVNQVGPDLIQFAATGHNLGQAGSVIASNGDPALQLVMHDRERVFDTVLDVHLLHGALIHIGIFFDGADKIGDARRAVLKFLGDAIHFQERCKASEFGADGRASSLGETREMGVGEIGIGEVRSKLPSLGDVVRFEPGLDGLFALDACKFVLELGGR